MASLFHRMLETPALYNLSQALLAPGARRELGKRYREIFSGSAGRILDVGCGPWLTTPGPEQGVIVGIDQNPAYILKYAESVERTSTLAQAESAKKIVGVVGSADALPFLDETFDESRSIGLLHHLSSEEVGRAVVEMCRCTRVGGRIVILDAILPRRPLLRPLAWALRRADRGEWMRRESELAGLVRAAWPGDWSQNRFTYSYNGLETVCLILTKANSKPSAK